MMPLEGRQDNFVLGEESGERRNARDGEHADKAAPVGERHLLAESAHGVQVVRVYLVNQAAGDEEQGALEEGVRKDVEGGGCPAGGNDGVAGFAGAKSKHHVAELRKRRVGENAFDVLLRASDDCCKNHGEGADPHNERERVAAHGEEREESCDQINARDHHGGTVDNGRNRCRTFHRVRKPDMHREHGGLAPATRKDKDGSDDERVSLAYDHKAEVYRFFLEGGERKAVQGKEVKTLHHVAHDHDTEQEETVGKAREDERLLGCAYGRGLVIPETDEKVAGYTHEFPEDEHLEKVRGGHETEHAEAEQRKNREETAGAAVAPHITDAVNVHEEGYHRDHHEHHHRKRIDEEANLCGEMFRKTQERKIEQDRFLRGESGAEVVYRDNQRGNHGNAVSDDGECGSSLVGFSSKEKSVDRKHKERHQEDEIADGNVVNHGGPSTVLRPGSCSDGTSTR